MIYFEGRYSAPQSLTPGPGPLEGHLDSGVSQLVLNSIAVHPQHVELECSL